MILIFKNRNELRVSRARTFWKAQFTRHFMLSICENLLPFAKAESPWKQSIPSLLNQHFKLSDCASTTWKNFTLISEKIIDRQHNQENKVLQCPAISERDSVYLERCSGAAGAVVGWIKGFVAQRTIQGTTVITWQKSCWSYQKKIYYCPQNSFHITLMKSRFFSSITIWQKLLPVVLSTKWQSPNERLLWIKKPSRFP